ncbi:hypothetical protein JTB14_026588 [Gonioctena quinquepunctata]|nr:hypothetical protein JTB14_026588 [Gonioctena quinquepunctata]
MRKSVRWKSWEYVASLAWKDDRNVASLTTFTAEFPKGIDNRFDKHRKETMDKQILFWNTIGTWKMTDNWYMEEEDSLISRYKNVMRSSTTCSMNAWPQCERAATQRDKKKTLTISRVWGRKAF